MLTSLQRWLAIRVDYLGVLLTFAVAMLTVGTRFTISPGQTGLVLSYILSGQATQVLLPFTLYHQCRILSFRFALMVQQGTEVENNMNSVERILHYATDIEQEAPHEIPNQKPPFSWPAQGRIVLKNIVLKYRPELPSVLKGLSMDVKAGEKVGIVGRQINCL